jgi:hypothetical protein
VSDELDPEVIADLQLRAATERDPTRSRNPPNWSPPTVIGVVPCRARCGAVVGWTAEAEDAFETWNRILLAKREAPLDKTRIVFCVACRRGGRESTAADNRKHVDQTADVIRKLKASAKPDQERDLLAKLEKLHHPDIPGLLEALRAKREKQTPGRRAKTSEVVS